MHPLHSIYKRHKMTINTPDGYTFYIGWGGMVVDNLQPAPYSEEIDLSWNSLEDFISDSDGYFEMFDARQNNEWDAIYLGEEV